MFVGPGFKNVDMNFYKSFRLNERSRCRCGRRCTTSFNHSNQYIDYYNLDAVSMSEPYVQSEKGGIYGYAGQPEDERRKIQFGLKLIF